MTIVNAAWTPQVNMLLIWCDCGYFFWHRSDRWKVRCSQCGGAHNLGTLRAALVSPHSSEVGR